MGVYLLGVHLTERAPHGRVSHGRVVLRLSDFQFGVFGKKSLHPTVASALFTFVSDDPRDESRCPQMPILPFLAKLLLQHLLFIPHPQS
jgi:hypothetical protein